MTYTFAYKTSDGVRHEASMDAPSREAVFEALRARGIKAIKVVAADGSKANGAPRRVPRLTSLVPIVAAIAALVSLASLLSLKSLLPNGTPPAPAFETDQTRRQVIGDVAVIEKGIRTGWADVFEHEGDRFLASFAIPGVKAGQRNTTVEELEAALKREVAASPEDGMEARQIKAMVEGIKAEARQYTAAGGSLAEYAKRLTERQDAEIAVFERAKEQLEAAKKSKQGDALMAYWEALNDQLRNLGIRPLTLDE